MLHIPQGMQPPSKHTWLSLVGLRELREEKNMKFGNVGERGIGKGYDQYTLYTYEDSKREINSVLNIGIKIITFW